MNWAKALTAAIPAPAPSAALAVVVRSSAVRRRSRGDDSRWVRYCTTMPAMPPTIAPMAAPSPVVTGAFLIVLVRVPRVSRTNTPPYLRCTRCAASNCSRAASTLAARFMIGQEMMSNSLGRVAMLLLCLDTLGRYRVADQCFRNRPPPRYNRLDAPFACLLLHGTLHARKAPRGDVHGGGQHGDVVLGEPLCAAQALHAIERFPDALHEAERLDRARQFAVLDQEGAVAGHSGEDRFHRMHGIRVVEACHIDTPINTLDHLGDIGVTSA